MIGNDDELGQDPFVVYVTVKLPTPDEERLIVPFAALEKTSPELPVNVPPVSPLTVALGKVAV